jgi:hypothetical protein
MIVSKIAYHFFQKRKLLKDIVFKNLPIEYKTCPEIATSLNKIKTGKKLKLIFGKVNPEHIYGILGELVKEGKAEFFLKDHPSRIFKKEGSRRYYYRKARS